MMPKTFAQGRSGGNVGVNFIFAEFRELVTVASQHRGRKGKCCYTLDGLSPSGEDFPLLLEMTQYAAWR